MKGNPYWDEKESENLTKAILKLNNSIDHVNNRKVTQELKDQAATHKEEEAKSNDKETTEEDLGAKPSKKIKKTQSKAPKIANPESPEGDSQKDDNEEPKIVNKRQIGIVKVNVSKPLMSKQSKIVSKSILSEFNKKNKSDAWD